MSTSSQAKLQKEPDVFRSVQAMFQAFSQDMSFSVLNSPYHSVLSPLLWLGRITGTCYLTPTTASSSKIWSICLRLYCGLVFFVLLATGIRFLTFFNQHISASMLLSSVTLLKMLLLIYIILCLASHLHIMIIQKKLDTFFLSLKTQRLFHGVPHKYFLRKLSLGMVLGIIVKAIINSTIAIMASSHIVHLPYTPTVIPGTMKFFWIFGFAIFYSQVSLMYAIAFMTILCAIVVTNLKVLSKEMELPKEPIPVYQKRYHSLVEFARQIDNSFRYYIALSYALVLPMICFTLFDIVRGKDMKTENTFIFLFWTGMLAFDLLLLSIPAICLFEEGLKPLDVLYKLYNRDGAASSEKTIQIHLFASQISTANLGVTAAGFFIITRPLILTITSALVTYFVVVIQFATCNSGTGAASNCHCHCYNASHINITM